MYCPEFKRTIVNEALSQERGGIDRVAKKYKIGRTTLFDWIKGHGKDIFGVKLKKGRPKDWNLSSKLKIIIETQSMNDQQLGEYLRRKGLYYSQVLQWKAEVLEEVKKDGRKLPEAEGILLKKVRELERELKLKDRALKEATALLILKKKAELIWPAHEEEESTTTTDKPSSNSSKKPTKTEPD